MFSMVFSRFSSFSTGFSQVLAGSALRRCRPGGSRGARLPAEHRGSTAPAAGAAAAGGRGCGVGRCETLEGDQVRMGLEITMVTMVAMVAIWTYIYYDYYGYYGYGYSIYYG